LAKFVHAHRVDYPKFNAGEQGELASPRISRLDWLRLLGFIWYDPRMAGLGTTKPYHFTGEPERMQILHLNNLCDRRSGHHHLLRRPPGAISGVVRAPETGHKHSKSWFVDEQQTDVAEIHQPTQKPDAHEYCAYDRVHSRSGCHKIGIGTVREMKMSATIVHERYFRA